MWRYVNRIRPSRRRAYSGSIGSLTFSSNSLCSQTSSTDTIRTPTRRYESSLNALPSPAPASTATSWPALISSSAPAGVSATRYSSGLISLATPIRTRRRGGARAPRRRGRAGAGAPARPARRRPAARRPAGGRGARAGGGRAGGGAPRPRGGGRGGRGGAGGGGGGGGRAGVLAGAGA